MAQPHETGNPLVTANKPITDLLGAPLGPDWTVEGLAEQLLSAIAAQRSEEAQEFVFDAAGGTDRQSRRLLRPLLACLATKSAAEAGTSATLYGGHFSFKRTGPTGPVWILGQFENRPGSVRVTLRRSPSLPEGPEARPGQLAALTNAPPQSSDKALSAPTAEVLTILEYLKSGPKTYSQIRHFLYLEGWETRSSETSRMIDELVAQALVEVESTKGEHRLTSRGRSVTDGLAAA